MKKIVLYKYFKKESDYNLIELTYSFWHFLSGNSRWFCRIWTEGHYTDSYGKTKYEAFRKAINR